MILRRGLTLIELLAALALLSMVAVATATWLRIGARAAQAASQHLGPWQAQQAALRLLRDDCRLGATRVVSEDGLELQLRTLHRLQQRGAASVTWRIDPEGTVWRREGAEPDASQRTVWVDAHPGRFQADEGGSLWWQQNEAQHLIWSAAW
ncbi:MAG: prepilin-type N-terminal cleavage/methylation domain-containing protein [Planctomycetota bacterium]|jgi:prepilin-type N-terminal cleavage/methylation domain-containing protein|nr:prepilin-type N-terminal cleavage/methylation domain-containing protein [Planctomycetota bacterium]